MDSRDFVQTLDAPAEGSPQGRPFRKAVQRGLGVFLPPLLTVVVFLWIGGMVHYYALRPVEDLARYVIARQIQDIRPANGRTETELVLDGRTFRRMSDDTYIPIEVYAAVRRELGRDFADRLTGEGAWEQFVQIRYLKPHLVVPAFLALFVLVLYVLGKLLAGGLGGFFWQAFENVVSRVPVVRNVYSSVKQVTDFLVNQQEIRYTRVVAIEYPRKGTWALGFVTGEGLLDVEAAANEPVLTVLVPTSPMPVTGFACVVPRSEVLDLNMTVDQALQFLISCGVVVPPNDQKVRNQRNADRQGLLASKLTASGSRRTAADGSDTTGTTPAAPQAPSPPGGPAARDAQ
jgi:uncharacterized membrane protein